MWEAILYKKSIKTVRFACQLCQMRLAVFCVSCQFQTWNVIAMISIFVAFCRHLLSHRDKVVVCEDCGEETTDYRALANHRSSHHVISSRSGTLTTRTYPCYACNKVFGSRSSQQIHMRIHTGERPYSCKYCVKAFADGGTLRKHERIHTGEKPYVCPICQKAFNQRVSFFSKFYRRAKTLSCHTTFSCSISTLKSLVYVFLKPGLFLSLLIIIIMNFSFD